jgi:hypothetical protein
MKYLIIFCVFILSISPLEAKTKKRHKTHKKENSKYYKVSRKGKRRHHGNGPDLKKMTSTDKYIDEPQNGVTPIENNNKN